MASVTVYVCLCLCICDLKEKWLELSAPNLVHILYGIRSEGLRSKRQRLHGYENHGHVVATEVCFYGPVLL